MGIFEVFYAPGKLFESLPERKLAWILPYVLNIVLACLVSALVFHYIGMENILRQQFEGTRMSPDQMEKIIAQAASAPAWRNYLNAVLGSALMYPFIALLIWVFALMATKDAKYGNQFTMVVHAYFPYQLIVSIMSAAILMAAPDPLQLDVRNLIATNAAVFLNKSEVSKALYSLAGSIDLLSFAEMFLLALGFAKVNKSKFGYGLAGVLVLWVLYVSVKVILSLLF